MSRSPLIPPSPSDKDYDAVREANADETVFAEEDPISLFGRWLADARAKEPNDPNAMALATADSNGAPDVRMVLLKDFDADGFVFFTNLESAKGRQLADNPTAALLFHWKSLRRQVRIRGPVSPVTSEEADDYFKSRARDARIGAWASDQSRPLESRFALEKRIAEYGVRFGLGDVPRPAHWSGFRVRPQSVEFWRDRPFRLHDRLQFERDEETGRWTSRRLYP